MISERSKTFSRETAWRAQNLREMRAMRDLPILEKLRLVEEMGDFVEQMRQVSQAVEKEKGSGRTL